MGKRKIRIGIIVCLMLMMQPLKGFAYMGSMGYEPGISAADPYEDGTYAYREICFLSGTPVILEGTLTVKKSARQGSVNTTYTYSLENIEQEASINRVIMMETLSETKENGQVVEYAKITRRPTEIVRIGGNTFQLTEYRFTRSGIMDPQPAVYYNTGEYTLKKEYRIDTDGTAHVEISGRQYGYDQHWSSAKAGTCKVSIEVRKQNNDAANSWEGFAKVAVSNTAKKGFQYIENEPWQISFEGGYVEKNWEESVLEYDATLPEFDKNGKPTEVLVHYNERIGLDTEPVNTRLMVPDLKHLRGHWAEEPVKILFSLEVLPGLSENFNPAKYVTRRDFTVMLVRGIKDIPEDPDMIKRTTTTVSRRSQPVENSPFADVKTEDPFFTEIKTASSRGIIQGTGQAYFSPDRYITTAEAVTMLIRAIGLEGLAPYPYTTTLFTDNEAIPAYARNAAVVAGYIGLVEGDSRGNFLPNENLTYERASALIYRLIRYMGEELEKDYRERILANLG